MHKKEQALQLILQQKLLPLYYQQNAETSRSVLEALYAGGMRVVEYTNRGDQALENFRILQQVKRTMPGLMLGIGTIKTAADAVKFIDAGADFIIAPTINVEVSQKTLSAGLLWIPGCMTPTEISMAEAAGATLVKLFPGNLLGPAFVTSIRELFPRMHFMPTGGVEAEKRNLKKWFQAGVAAVGMGSKLITKEMIEEKDFKGLRKAVIEALELVNAVAGKGSRNFGHVL